MTDTFNSSDNGNKTGKIVFASGAALGLIMLLEHLVKARAASIAGANGYGAYMLLTLCTVAACAIPILSSMANATMKWATVGCAGLGELLAIICMYFKRPDATGTYIPWTPYLHCGILMIALVLPLLVALMGKTAAAIAPNPEE